MRDRYRNFIGVCVLNNIERLCLEKEREESLSQLKITWVEVLGKTECVCVMIDSEIERERERERERESRQTAKECE